MFERMKWYDELPDPSIDVYEPYLNLFFETMYERQMIWKRRFIDNLPPPWTKNRILRDYKFTNVYRELDRSSQWQIQNILLDEKLSLKNLIWKMMVYRFFNNPQTFEIGKQNWRNGIPDYDDYNVEIFADFIYSVRKSGINPFTNAYYINSDAASGKGRDYCYTKIVLPYLNKNIDKLLLTTRISKSPIEIIDYLKTIPGVADFMAHEFYQDFTYVSLYTDKNFMSFSQNDYTFVGPGASVGIRLIFPSLNYNEQIKGIYVLRDIASEKLKEISIKKGEEMQFVYWDKNNKKYEITKKCNLTLHQIEMWLCEFSKYWKMKIGEGKKRIRFTPGDNLKYI